MRLRIFIILLLFGLLNMPQQMNGEDLGSNRSSKAITTHLAKDSLQMLTDSRSDAQQCLDGLAWQPEQFEVTFQPAINERYDGKLNFPSARTTGNARLDTVVLEWFAAREHQKTVVSDRVVLVVHELGSSMPFGKTIARQLSAFGVHTFLIHLPHYADRKTESKMSGGEKLVSGMPQAVADIRRSRDAIMQWPELKAQEIALVGLSLGGILSATTGSLDASFDSVHLLLAGGDLNGILTNGRKEPEKVMQSLKASGFDESQIALAISRVEPLRIAHRLNPETTWLYTGRYDTTIPRANSDALAECIGLKSSHRIMMLADHYTGAIFLPLIVANIAHVINGKEEIQDQPATEVESTPAALEN